MGWPGHSRIKTVPIIIELDISENMEALSCMSAVGQAMNTLKTNGSFISTGYMKPEGVVIEINGKFYKKTFDLEEVAWTSNEKKEKLIVNNIDVTHLLQPLRLEKLLSRDERYLREYPRTLAEICKEYVADLEDENQISGLDHEIQGIKKSLGRSLFPFIKSIVASKQVGEIQ